MSDSRHFSSDDPSLLNDPHSDPTQSNDGRPKRSVATGEELDSHVNGSNKKMKSDAVASSSAADSDPSVSLLSGGSHMYYPHSAHQYMQMQPHQYMITQSGAVPAGTVTQGHQQQVQQAQPVYPMPVTVLGPNQVPIYQPMSLGYAQQPLAAAAAPVRPTGEGGAADEDERGVSCHQCKSNKPKNLLLFCTTRADFGRKRRCRKKYCDACLRRSYNQAIHSMTSDELVRWQCPSCARNCSCAACIRKSGGGAGANSVVTPAKKRTAGDESTTPGTAEVQGTPSTVDSAGAHNVANAANAVSAVNNSSSTPSSTSRASAKQIAQPAIQYQSYPAHHHQPISQPQYGYPIQSYPFQVQPSAAAAAMHYQQRYQMPYFHPNQPGQYYIPTTAISQQQQQAHLVTQAGVVSAAQRASNYYEPQNKAEDTANSMMAPDIQP